MPIPDFQSIMLPLLRITADGQEHKQREVSDALATHFKLTNAEKDEILPSGRQSRFSNRVAWSIVYLRKAGLIENSKRGIFCITEQGKSLLKKKPSKIDIKLLKQYPGIREWHGANRITDDTDLELDLESDPEVEKDRDIEIEVAKGDRLLEEANMVTYNESGKIDADISYWIFQADPKHYDLDNELKKAINYEMKNSNWTVNQYAQKIHTGDIAFLWAAGKNAGILAVAKIGSYPYYDTEADGPFISEKKRGDGKQLWVDISIDYVLPERITRESLLKHPVLKSMQILRSPQGTNFPVTYEEAQALNDLIYNIVRPIYTSDQFSEDTGLDKETLERWARAIERKGQAILYGPPGTGKTYLAERFAEYLISEDDGFKEVVQFHPAYAYEDFIQGIRPQSRDDGVLIYPVVSGRFLEFCERAESRQGTCVMIIDEINRANLARVFGELMYLLEYRDREIPLSGGGALRIPSNVRIIGTMNTADRSIALVDHALRRRFAFLALRPNYEVLRRYHQKKVTNFPIDGLIQVLRQLNSQLDRHFEVGISFFLRDALQEELEDIWTMEIIPYLEEYFFDQTEKLDEFSWEKVKEKIGI